MMSPRVFISYSHDSPDHKARVRALADRLRRDGVDCMLDQYVEAPSEGWTLWMERQLVRGPYPLILSQCLRFSDCLIHSFKSLVPRSITLAIHAPLDSDILPIDRTT